MIGLNLTPISEIVIFSLRDVKEFTDRQVAQINAARAFCSDYSSPNQNGQEAFFREPNLNENTQEAQYFYKATDDIAGGVTSTPIADMLERINQSLPPINSKRIVIFASTPLIEDEDQQILNKFGDRSDIEVYLWIFGLNECGQLFPMNPAPLRHLMDGVINVSSEHDRPVELQDWKGKYVGGVPYRSRVNIRPVDSAIFEGSVPPDSVASIYEDGGVRCGTASVRGNSHRQHGEPRQDAVGIGMFGGLEERTIWLTVVADGVGTKRLSHIYAQLLIDSARKAFVKILKFPGASAKALSELCMEIMQSVVQECGQPGDKLIDQASTLRIAVVQKMNEDLTYSAAKIGDGFSGILDYQLNESSSHLTSIFEEAENLDGWTPSLPADMPDIQIKSGEMYPGQTLVLATDGGYVSWLSDNTMHNVIAHSNLSEAQLIARLDIDDSRTHDDRSIAFIHFFAKDTGHKEL